MPRKMIQGQCGSTPWKENGLSALFAINLNISKTSEKLSRYPYFHFDLNCGSGYNDAAGCIGSPIAFLNQVDAIKKSPVVACFVDNSKEAIVALSALPTTRRPSIFCFHGNNASFVTAIPNIIRYFGENPKFAIGSVVSDPNGHKDIPFAELSALFQQCERLDLIINWNGTAFKRSRGSLKTKYATLARVACLPKMFKKKFWHIREPVSMHQFSIIVGRNYETGDYKKLGFHSIHTAAGRSIIERLDNGDICPLQELCRVSPAPCLSCDKGNGNADSQGIVQVRRSGYRTTPLMLPGMGNV